ncbi:hypothetical protein ACWGDE_11930 [Streptomyces sp. NPDC054956]
MLADTDHHITSANANGLAAVASDAQTEEALERSRAASRALLTARRWDEARQAARTALDAYGPDAELSLVLALGHEGEDDDEEDDRAEQVYQDALERFPDHLGLLTGYAELCLRTDFQDRPARNTRGPALAARVAELAPDSPEAQRVARARNVPWWPTRTDRPPSTTRTQLYDLRQALAGRDVRAAEQQAGANAGERPDDVRRAMLAEALRELARPGRVLLVPLVRRPAETAFVRAVLLSAFLVAVAVLELPQWLWWVGLVVHGAPRVWLGRVLRRARSRSGPSAAYPAPNESPEQPSQQSLQDSAQQNPQGSPLPDLPPVPPATRRELGLSLAAVAVVLGSLAGVGVWAYEVRTAYPRYEVVAPETFQGMSLLSDSLLDQSLEVFAPTVPEGYKSFTLAYGNFATNDVRISVYGMTGDMHEMSRELVASFVDSSRAGAESVGSTMNRSWTPAPAPTGGVWLECMDLTAPAPAGGGRYTLCTWGDKGSFGIVSVVGPELMPRADSLTRELRAALIHSADDAEEHRG